MMWRSRKFWGIAAAVVLLVAAVQIYRTIYPSPPDLTGRGYTQVEARVRNYSLQEDGSFEPSLIAWSDEPAVVEKIAAVLRTGTNAVDCRCVNIVTLKFSRPDGARSYVRLTPSHGSDDCQIRVDGHRFRVDRQQWLAAVAPLGLPEAAWTGAPTE